MAYSTLFPQTSGSKRLDALYQLDRSVKAAPSPTAPRLTSSGQKLTPQEIWRRSVAIDRNPNQPHTRAALNINPPRQEQLAKPGPITMGAAVPSPVQGAAAPAAGGSRPPDLVKPGPVFPPPPGGVPPPPGPVFPPPGGGFGFNPGVELAGAQTVGGGNTELPGGADMNWDPRPQPQGPRQTPTWDPVARRYTTVSQAAGVPPPPPSMAQAAQPVNPYRGRQGGRGGRVAPRRGAGKSRWRVG